MFAAPGAVHPVAAGTAVQRARVLGVGGQRAAALHAAVLAARAADAAPRAVAARQGRRLPRARQLRLYRERIKPL